MAQPPRSSREVPREPNLPPAHMYIRAGVGPPCWEPPFGRFREVFFREVAISGIQPEVAPHLGDVGQMSRRLTEDPGRLPERPQNPSIPGQRDSGQPLRWRAVGTVPEPAAADQEGGEKESLVVTPAAADRRASASVVFDRPRRSGYCHVPHNGCTCWRQSPPR